MKKIKISIDSTIFSLEAILSACYGFIDGYYISLDKKGKKILVSIESKLAEDLKTKEIEGRFKNELLHNALRIKISNNNSEIREYIISQALLSSFPAPASESENWESQKLDDPLGIAIPWEEKFGNGAEKNTYKKSKKRK